MTLEQGVLLNNRYRIIEVLGQGGMGAVYHAIDENLGVEVAVKENLYLSDEYSRQFKQEATILASLKHANLPRVVDYFSINGQGQYLVMDFIIGEDLRERMERLGKLEEREAVLIGAAVCDALDFLHNRPNPVIHRDIKPGNIKITPDGQIALVDFGLAKVFEASQNTMTGARAMTPGYSPPEQYGTAHTDARSDVYSLAATLYSALSGIIPEDGLARATGSVELTPLLKRCPQMSPRLAEVVEKGLAIQPHERYQSVREFKEALLGTLPEVGSEAKEVALAPIPSRPRTEVIEGEVYSESSSSPLASKSERGRTGGWFSLDNGGNWLALVLLIALLGSGTWMLFNPNHAGGNGGSGLAATLTVQASATEDCLGEGCVALSNLSVTGKATVTLGPSPTHTMMPTEAATATPQPSPTPSPTPIGGEIAEIAFATDRTGLPQIWIMDANGNNLVQVTNMAEGACQPSWSPDGQRMVFTSPCSGKRDVYARSSLYLIDRDGKNLVALPASPEGDYDPAWSPDGERIAYVSLVNGLPKIFIMNLADQSSVLFSDSAYSDKHPAWSPSGAQLAFVRERTALQIWVASDNGQSEFQLTRSGDINDSWPSWSPDSEVIYFSQNPIKFPVPWLMGIRYEDRETTKEFRVSPQNYPGLGPVAHANSSPDGQWLVFESWPDGSNHDIYRMTIGGANLQRLTSDRGADFDPAWRPGE